MSLTDPIGDMLARIKNSQLRNHKKVEMPSSNFKMKIADVLKNEGYINGFNVDKNDNKQVLIIEFSDWAMLSTVSVDRPCTELTWN